MRGLKNVVALLLVFTLLFTNMSLSLSFADSPDEAGLVMPEQIKKSNNKYLNEYKDNYYLDIAKYNIIKNPEGAMNTVANVMFSAQKTLGYFLVALFYYSFEFNLFDLFKNEIEAIQKGLKQTLFDELSAFAILMLGVFFIIKIMRDQKTEIWVAMVQIVLIVAVSTFFMLKPIEFLTGIDNMSKYLSKQVLAGTYKASESGMPETAVIAATNEIWQMYVHTPWQILEFGDIKLAKQNEDKILRLAPDSDARKAIIQDLSSDKEHFTPKWGGDRIGNMVVYMIPLMIKALLVIFLSLMQLAYQMLTIFFALGGPFVFLVSLIPFFGIRLFQNWFLKIIGFQGIKAVVALVLALVCVFDSVLITLSDKYGWNVVLILQLVVALIVVWKHEEFIGLFSRIRMAATGQAPMGREMRKDVNIENSLLRRGFLRNSTKDNTDAYSDTMKGKGKDAATRSSSEKIDPNNKGFKNKTAKDSNSSQNINKTRKQNEFKNLMTEAESVLQYQYEDQKSTAEIKAQKLGKQVQYPEFVKKVQAREKLGAPRFEEREVVAVANQLKKIKEAGGDPKDLIKESSTISKDIQRPSGINMTNVNKNLGIQNEEDAKRQELKNYSADYVNEFNSKYKNNYKPEFMENLIRGHGKDNVRSALDTMDRINDKKEIQNPAGYLVSVLKNDNAKKDTGAANIRPKNIEGTVNADKSSINLNNTNMINENISLNKNKNLDFKPEYLKRDHEVSNMQNFNVNPSINKEIKLNAKVGPYKSSEFKAEYPNKEQVINNYTKHSILKDAGINLDSKPGINQSVEFKMDGINPGYLGMDSIKPILNDEMSKIKAPSFEMTQFEESQEKYTQLSGKLEQIQRNIKKDFEKNQSSISDIKENIVSEEKPDTASMKPVNLDISSIKEELFKDAIGSIKMTGEDKQNKSINLNMRKSESKG